MQKRKKERNEQTKKLGAKELTKIKIKGTNEAKRILNEWMKTKEKRTANKKEKQNVSLTRKNREWRKHN